MKDFLRKAWSFGLGFFDFTRDRVESLVEEMVRRGEITQQESPEAVKQLLDTGPGGPGGPGGQGKGAGSQGPGGGETVGYGYAGVGR